MKVRQYLRISMRHFKLVETLSYNWRDMYYPPSPTNLGECVYTLNTSNFVWPTGITYPEMRQARNDVLIGMRL